MGTNKFRPKNCSNLTVLFVPTDLIKTSCQTSLLGGREYESLVTGKVSRGRTTKNSKPDGHNWITLSFPSICLFGTLSKFQGRLQTRSEDDNGLILQVIWVYLIWWTSWPCSTGWQPSEAGLMGWWLLCRSGEEMGVNQEGLRIWQEWKKYLEQTDSLLSWCQGVYYKTEEDMMRASSGDQDTGIKEGRWYKRFVSPEGSSSTLRLLPAPALTLV